MHAQVVGQVTKQREHTERSFASEGMSLSRKDTIIIAMLVNMALLFVLFATATKRKETQDHAVNAIEPTKTEEVVAPVAVMKVESPAVKPQKPVDEIDQILQQYVVKAKTDVPPVQEVKKPVQKPVEVPSDHIEVIVKKGDVLSKIAKSYGTTTEELMKINQLENARLKIGQQLKIPKQKSLPIIQEPVTPPPQEDEYYIIKSGDNPWKIAKKFQLDFEDLLKLNDLDEAKARNLKIGQKIRIKAKKQ